MTNNTVKPLIKNHQGKLRLGKGWSYQEVKLAKLTKKDLRLLSQKLDKRRKTVYENNVNQLTKLGGN